ncbi:MAG: type ISP restriction/modification enzyme [Candidatus Helarchaeota archaeon]
MVPNQSMIKSTRELALNLANQTRRLKDTLMNKLKIEKNKNARLSNLFDKLKNEFQQELDINKFIDVFSQSLIFGYLFTWFDCHKKGVAFSIDMDPENVPQLDSGLKDIFYYFQNHKIKLADNSQISKILNDLEVILKKTDYEEIKKQIISTVNSNENPFMYFFEEFIRMIDPKEMKRKGVYFTPKPVVSFMIRSIDYFLKTRFDKKEGLCDKDLIVIDPASGTATFFNQIILFIYNKLKKSKKESQFNNLVNNRIIPNYYAFEIINSTCTVGLYNFLSLLNVLGVEVEKKPNFFALNVLEKPKLIPTGRKKTLDETLIILGNPPYNPISISVSSEMNEMMKEYYDAVRFEKKKSGLQDDYIKFIRFSHYKINQNGKGIVAFITNHSFLKGLIHRGMRNELMKDFNEIFVLNLHGGTRPPEWLPQGITNNENIFDIRIGTCIVFFIKKSKNDSSLIVKYHDKWGTRREKFDFLNQFNVSDIKWEILYTSLPPIKRNYFLKLNYDEQEYRVGIPVTCLFKKFKVGIQIGINEKFHEKNDIFNFEKINDDMEEYYYHPFNTCYLRFPSKSLHRDRGDFFPSIMSSDNREALILMRRPTRKMKKWKQFFITNGLVDRFYADYDNNYVFPFKYKNAVNLREEIKEFLSKSYGKQVTFPEIFHYTIGILASSFYANKFEDALMHEFPIISFPNDGEFFDNIARIGKLIKNAQLLKIKKKADIYITNNEQNTYSYQIKKVKYDESNESLYINDDVSISISLKAWNFYVGTRYPVREWFKYMAKYKLVLDEKKADSIAKILSAIDEIMKLEIELDQLIESNNFQILDCSNCQELIIEQVTKEAIKYFQKKKIKRFTSIEYVLKHVSTTLRLDPPEFERTALKVLNKVTKIDSKS